MTSAGEPRDLTLQPLDLRSQLDDRLPLNVGQDSDLGDEVGQVPPLVGSSPDRPIHDRLADKRAAEIVIQRLREFELQSHDAEAMPLALQQLAELSERPGRTFDAAAIAGVVFFPWALLSVWWERQKL